MSTIPTKHTKIETAERDMIIGSALSCVLSKAAPVGQCPTAEQLAAFVDGGGSEEERDQILGHMSTCDRCREIYVLTHDLNRPEAVQHNSRGWYMAGGSLAAAALVILTIKLIIQQPETQGQQVARTTAPQQQVAVVPPEVLNSQVTPTHNSQPQLPPANFTVSIAAHQLAQAATSDALAAAIGAPASDSFGFAGNNRRQATAFKAGKELFELELWLAAGDRERAGLAGERLAPLLRSVAGTTVEVRVENLLQSLESDESKEKVSDIVFQLEAMLNVSERRIARLGGWAAAARVATGVGKDPYFSCNPPELFLRELGATIPSEAQDVLRKLSRRHDLRDSKHMERLLDELTNTL